ncbi:hypothetical protein PAAG_12164 [Paracoccidioides lutzii Pb01]|uniref:Uncharacterized protein n=1 Tax=Paracoccidioides lutzii (strain ATCC MYA-826 / Pb01) TaxID=502779 RepID=A0A0A2V003_PARBA|nr:hypothetical protein PAAG_12164 [Paracoccidioides lutzii Pb01]KGQ01126.1 hypothetical protein PAAG_12164 [Paracoccidioides lutzii Pb01]
MPTAADAPATEEGRISSPMTKRSKIASIRSTTYSLLYSMGNSSTHPLTQPTTGIGSRERTVYGL